MGGKNAPVEVNESIRGVLHILSGFDADQMNGAFVDFQGNFVQWWNRRKRHSENKNKMAAEKKSLDVKKRRFKKQIRPKIFFQNWLHSDFLSTDCMRKVMSDFCACLVIVAAKGQ